MAKHDADARRERLFRIEKLYRSGRTFEQIAEKLDPPVSTQRVCQLLREARRWDCIRYQSGAIERKNDSAR